MREILFRGKRKDNGEWLQGDLRHWNSGEVGIHCDILHRTIKVDPETVGQFTGLVDKNDTRIFEGDVVRYGNRTGYVIFENGCFCVQDSMSQHHPAIDMVMFQWDVTVIGNIHDNPELLKGVEGNG